MQTGMLRVRLSAEEREYLLKSGIATGQLQEALELAADRGYVEVRPELVEVVRAALTDHLARFGFGADYEPTSEGRMMESLIDRLYRAARESEA